jgi:hypothetical protein
MCAFIESCRRLAAVTGTIALGTMMTVLTPGSAKAQNVDEWLAKSFSSANHTPGSARRMRLGATKTEPAQGSLTGGSRRISRPRSSKQSRSAQRRRGVRVASLGSSYQPRPEVGQSLAGRGVKWVASSGCLNARLRAVIYEVASAFGPVTVNSTCRSRRHNSRVGGARHSHHLSGNAVDFRVRGHARGVYAFLRSHASVGGLKFYRRGFFHIDTGSRRTW